MSKIFRVDIVEVETDDGSAELLETIWFYPSKSKAFPYIVKATCNFRNGREFTYSLNGYQRLPKQRRYYRGFLADALASALKKEKATEAANE